ncbi:serine/threonine-protein kinase [Vitiosangium sp. GDMCC 1.1324]|uniref:serine/threonine-protein kinase n=1 Tax=Vitiosangium sp. (strain GDMCC 1.1324) TaxID=2138576 RepID=UPI000D39AE60|nr:serine/threonine-protein kinase [Vitiosangium sp. GDMCC 1.1324]PTL82907.1 serine/threonine protein kinase [Vitiosangium sp. GDMCC 1.1324]
MRTVEFPSLDAEVAFLRGLTAVVRMADDILEDCLERGLNLDAAVDVFLTQCARLVHASAGFVCLRGTTRPVLTRVLGQLGMDVFEAASWKGTRNLSDGRMLFCTQLALGRLELGTLGLVVDGSFEDGGALVMKLVDAIGDQLDNAVLAFLALTDGRSVLERLDDLAPEEDPVTGPRGRIGRYELVTPLGTGGMAQVLVARTRGPEGLGRLVALKRILPHLASDPDIVKQFLDEARIGLRLSHANLVTFHDFGESQGAYYLVMELVRGVDFDRLLKTTRPSPPVTMAIVIQALHGLHAAHQARGEDGAPLQLVHRDLSPHNLMVGFDGRVKVLDFGVAKARAQRTVTLPGIVKGKPLYMSPEQARGRRLDLRSDLFSMGLILHEALTGVRAFDRGDELESMHAICDDRLSRPSAIPLPLWEVIEVALAKSPEQRYSSALQMAEALAEVCPPAREVEVGRLMAQHFPERLRGFERLERVHLSSNSAGAAPPQPARQRASAPDGSGR